MSPTPSLQSEPDIEVDITTCSTDLSATSVIEK